MSACCWFRPFRCGFTDPEGRTVPGLNGVHGASPQVRRGVALRRKNWMRGLLVAMLVALLLPATAYAAEGKEDNSIDFATFLEAVEGANYDYDGQGVTVK